MTSPPIFYLYYVLSTSWFFLFNTADIAFEIVLIFYDYTRSLIALVKKLNIELLLSVV
jgi:hypothetical protein